MAERKRIALIFKVNKDWMGGTYYVLNLINALNTLPDEQKPSITLLCTNEEDYEYACVRSQYPYLDYRLTFKPSYRQKIARIFNKVTRTILGKNFMAYNVFNEKVDAIYPILNRFNLSSESKRIFWIPDLQERYLPHFFSKEKIKFRDLQIKEMIWGNGHIVFSSQDALDSFNKFYPEGKHQRKSVFHFASAIPHRVENASDLVKNKYNAPDKFFYCANQFWAHKNHQTLFDAVKILKSRGIEVTIFCSGGTHDYRNPDYFSTLQKFIKDNSLENNIHILGFIDRRDQVALMQECSAIIQPSLFEGWSTSVEEAKAMNKFLILSDLPLHKEQVTKNGYFFDRLNPESLADCIEKFLKDNPQVEVSDYNKNILEAAKTFMKIIES